MTNKEAYPKKWDQLARTCKERAHWQCEHCGIEQYAVLTSKRGNPYFVYLHAAHKHHDRSNEHPELVCLCIACHARLDYTHQQRQARIRVELLKHLRLLIASGLVTAEMWG